MAIKPILFNTEMVRAILDGRKTVTRRVIKGAERYTGFIDICDDMSIIGVDRNGMEYDKSVSGLWATFEWDGVPDYPVVKAPYQPGDYVYVRETWSEWTDGYVYKAWNEPFPQPGRMPIMKWYPSIHMPKEAARIWLKVTDVRVERLRDIETDGMLQEGIEFNPGNEKAIHDDFHNLWDSTIKKKDLPLYGWDASPWVWVIEFERCEKPKET